jgi:ATP-dependent protease ClpP protease subunit
MYLPVVMLLDHLNRLTYDAVQIEMRRLAKENPGSRCILVVNSNGGAGVSAVDFVNHVRILDLKFSAKIYEAKSAAAFIAFSIADDIELLSSAEIGFHLGEIPVNANDVSSDEMIAKMRESLRGYNNAMNNLMEKLGIDKDKHLMAELHGSGWLRISAKECFERGLVQRLF